VSAATGDYFVKLMQWDAVLPEVQKRMVRAYLAYNSPAASSSAVGASSATPLPRPASLCPAELLFGCGVVAVQMPFLSGRPPSQEALASETVPGGLLASLADALVWLALHDMLYTDLRPPSVIMLADGDARLVDYDGMRVVRGAWGTAGAVGVASLR